MDCPDAIKEYWKSIDHSKTEENKSSEKDGGKKREHPSSKKSTPSRKSKSHNVAVVADSQLPAGALEDSASDGDSMPAIPSTSFSTEDRASPSVSVSSSTHSIPPLKIKRQIPRPPAIPKRKATPSLSNTSTSATSSATSVVVSSPSVSGTSLEEITPSVTRSPKAGTPNHVIPPDDHKSHVEEKRFVRPHGFERGLSVERIHGFLKRADRTFAVVQFKNCDVVEILALEIVKHYDHLFS
ncbi:hypothetical protein ANCCEY_07200 [Ancylostoma ceylanicum]|uniref:Uncharacterized protein n=1 Tax=Ancylostoma ceylanicum TaxID=53326 RepID=A0A0D6LUE2_9BILA|nr:hypothetical protein ANCCEY_07200 [Ancylostoma ceylanicum]